MATTGGKAPNIRPKRCSQVSVSTVTGMATSLVLLVQGGALEVALVSAKNVLGNCQVLANLSYSFRISWPKEMLQLVVGLKVVTKNPLSAFRSMALCARALPTPTRARVQILIFLSASARRRLG